MSSAKLRTGSAFALRLIAFLDLTFADDSVEAPSELRPGGAASRLVPGVWARRDPLEHAAAE